MRQSGAHNIMLTGWSLHNRDKLQKWGPILLLTARMMMVAWLLLHSRDKTAIEQNMIEANDDDGGPTRVAHQKWSL